MRLFLIIVALSPLLACKTAEQRIAEDDAKCLTYGVQKGSPPYVECRLQLDEQHARQRAINSTSPIGAIRNMAEQ